MRARDLKGVIVTLKDNKHEFSKKNIYVELWTIEYSLIGLGALFENQKDGSDISTDEFFGIGQLCKKLSHDIRAIKEKITNE